MNTRILGAVLCRRGHLSPGKGDVMECRRVGAIRFSGLIWPNWHPDTSVPLAGEALCGHHATAGQGSPWTLL